MSYVTLGRWDKNDLLSMDQFSKYDIGMIQQYAKILEPYSGIFHAPRENLDFCRGRIMKGIFRGESNTSVSTRTRESFKTAMTRLGGESDIFDEKTSSMEKGESFEDTLRYLDACADIFVIRDSVSGSLEEYASILKRPVINAGDGINEHPTQALQDMYTMLEFLGRISNLSIVFVGDLRYGRAVHSLVKAVRKFPNKIYGVSPPELGMPEELRGGDYRDINLSDLADIRPDVLYAARIQKNLMPQEERERHSYRLEPKILEMLPKHSIVMHPLPRTDEFPDELLRDERVKIFEQAYFGIPVRMALLATMLGYDEKVVSLQDRRY